MLRYLAIGLLIIFVVGGAAAAIVIGLRLGAAAPLVPKPATPPLVNVTYRLSGTTKRAVVTSGELDTTGQPLSVDIPWQTFARVPAGSDLYFSARNDTDKGTLTCEIIVDGKVIETSTHSEAGGKVACITTLP